MNLLILIGLVVLMFAGMYINRNTTTNVLYWLQLVMYAVLIVCLIIIFGTLLANLATSCW